MDSPYNILEVFPTPILTTLIPEEFSSIIPFLYNQPLVPNPKVDNMNYGDRSENTHILNEPECLDINNFILNLVIDYGKMLGYDYDSYKFTQSWVSHKHPGQQHIMHSHPNSLISGVFFFGETVDTQSTLTFHNPITGINASYIRPKKYPDYSKSPYASDQVSIEHNPGLLLLFPSYLVHSVPLNTTNLVRSSLAFNIVPSQGFGDESTLTELKF